MKEKNFMRKIENCGIESAEQEVIEIGGEKELGEQEIVEMGAEMKDYAGGLSGRIDEIKKKLEDAKLTEDEKQKLESELNDSEEQLLGLEEFVDDIEQGNYEEIIEK